MEQQWHDILLHNDNGDAAFHKGAPLLVEALQVISAVCAIPAATRLGLHLRDAQQSSAADPAGATYTERHVYQEHAERIAVAAPLLRQLRCFFRETPLLAAAAASSAEQQQPAVVSMDALDGLLVPTAWAAELCATASQAGSGDDCNDDTPRTTSPHADHHDHHVADATSTASLAALMAHPLFSYKSFLRHLDRLSQLVSMGETFSASEPRVKVLQSRFSLYRAYNGAREDEYHPTFGGGDIKRAPKCDLRRLETCMSAASVVSFLEQLRRERPSYPLYSEEQIAENMLEAVTTPAATAATSAAKKSAADRAARASTRTSISVAEALRRFFGTDVTRAERVITEEGLCLRPSYASDSTDHWLSLQRLADSGSNPRASLAGRLLQHLLSTSGGADGQGELLAQLIQPILKRVLDSGSSYDRVELELTVTGTDPMELPKLARWCAQSGLLESCPGVFFRFLIVQDGYAKVGSSNSNSNSSGGGQKDSSSEGAPALFFDSVLKNIFGPIWEAYRSAASTQETELSAEGELNKGNSATRAELLALLARTTGFSVSLTRAAAVQEMPHRGNPAHQFPLPSPSTTTTTTAAAEGGAAPPDAFFVYHIWRNVQLLNAFLVASGPKAATNEVEARHAASAPAAAAAAAKSKQKSGSGNAQWSRRAAFTFILHGGANSRTLFGESVLGLLLADAVVNPALTFEWSPLTYLYMLTQRHVILTPSRNRCSSTSVKAALDTAAIPLAVQAGLHVSVVTLDPLFYDTTNDALSEELMELTKQRGLANADVTEMCLRGLEATGGSCFTWAQRRHLFGYAWPHARARFNQFAATQVSSLRLHHRACALEHELDLLFAAHHGTVHQLATSAATGAAALVSTAVVPDKADQHETETRALLYLPPTTAALLNPATAHRRTANGSARALQREHDPRLLQHLSGYRAHEAQMQYPRILISGPDRAGPSAAAKRLMHAMATREAYQKCVVRADDAACRPASPVASTLAKEMTGQKPVWVDGVLDVCEPSTATTTAAAAATPMDAAAGSVKRSNIRVSKSAATTTGSAAAAAAAMSRVPIPTWRQFQEDIRTLRTIASTDPTVAKYANKRLDMLESKYKLHVALTNDDEENYSITVSPTTASALQGVDDKSLANASALLATADAGHGSSGHAGGSPSTAPGQPLYTAAAAAGSHTQLQRRIVQPIRGDAHNCVKVDVHCHMASGITAKSLLAFMRRKMRDHPDDVVGVDEKTGQPITLVQFFSEVLPHDQHPRLRKQQQQRRLRQAAGEADGDDGRGAQGYEDAETASAAAAEAVARILSEMPIAALQVHAGKATFHRFDRFNHRFSPMGMSSLRSLFLKTENFMQGRYFAELIRGSFEQNEMEGNTFTENRLSIYGRTPHEWDRLSRWFVLHGMSHRTNSWMIQIPRLFHLYQRSGVLRSFQEMLTNIFEPLWAASCYPEKHPYLHFFLSHVSGFDSVDNESDREPDQTIDVTPAQWTAAENPPFAYYMFYMWANITTLNRYRAARGFNTFQFRPHAGESGDPDHMADVFFLADGIGHGINLDKRPVLQYLYYLAQIPLAIVPMSNNALFCRYGDHPLPRFLHRGLNIAIGTDGALIFHRTEQPLLEEYGTAEALWNLSAADICELAASSVRTCGFPSARKRAWLGPLYHLRSIAGNDVTKSHVPQTRCAFRYEAYMEEVSYLQSRASCEMSCRAMLTPLEEELNIMDTIGISREELLARRWAGAAITAKKATKLPVAADRPARISAAHEKSQL